jgi:hypothetical protein
MSHNTSSPQQINGISILSTPARQVRQPDPIDPMNLFINWGMNILKINYMDIMRKASYGACDKPALR